MPTRAPDFWPEQLRTALAAYDESLLRRVATRLAKVRNQWPVPELIEKCSATLSNPATVDRRLAELSPVCRQLLVLIDYTRDPQLPVGNLVEIAAALGAPDGLVPIVELLEAGVLFPAHMGATGRLKDFRFALAQTASGQLQLFSLPLVCSRARKAGETPWPSVQHLTEPKSSAAPQETDGLEWPLRLAALHQQALQSPFRRTQAGDFFKRDRNRLEQDALLNRPPTEEVVPLPDLPFFVVSLAEAEKILEPADGELRAGMLPAAWSEGLQATLASLWTALFRVDDWNPLNGWERSDGHNPFRSACLLALMLLANAPEDGWLSIQDIDAWLRDHHPAWRGKHDPWIGTFLLGIFFHMRALQLRPSLAPEGSKRQGGKEASDGHAVRLSPTGRWLLGLADAPAVSPVFPRTLLVQPNLEIIVYRQGLTPELIADLSRFAQWQTQGPACTLQLGPETVYRALEAGVGFEAILQTLEQHGTRPIPPAVIEMLRTWSNKRERLSVYASAAILEFARPEDMEAALARGLDAVRLTDRLALVPSESSIDYSHFRLLGTRDYGLPPERCVEVEDDGVSLNVDVSRSDLLLDAELQRFAEPVRHATAEGQKPYLITPASLAAARNAGFTRAALEKWFLQRTGQPATAAACLLMSATPRQDETAASTPSQDGKLQLRRLIVLQVANELLADGLMQWPQTRRLIQERLGPIALVIQEDHLAALAEKLRELGISLSKSDL